MAEEKGSSYWKANAMMWQGCVSALTGRAAEAIDILPLRSLRIGRSQQRFTHLSFLYTWRACAELGQVREAWHHINEAMTTAEKSQEKWVEAEIQRTAGEIAFISPEANAAKARATSAPSW